MSRLVYRIICFLSDEVDMGLRAKKLGVNLAVTTEAKAWHQHLNAGGGKHRMFYTSYLMGRNKVYLAKKHFGFWRSAEQLAFHSFLFFKGVVGTILCVCILLFAAVIGINAYMISFSKKNFVTVDELKADSYDCILVLGAGLWSGKPSPMLKERLDFSLEAYNKGCSDRFLVSGDHGTKSYDEVNAMKDYLVENGISADCVYIDHAGFSTYESMYRARDVFKVQKVLIVTQKYHLYRAVYVARQLGIEAYGLDREELKYPVKNNIREAAARVKDFFYCIAEPEPTYLGEEIPIKTASASLTDDKVKV